MRLLASEAKGSSGRVEVSRWGCWLSASWRNKSSAAGRFAIVLRVGLGDGPGFGSGRRGGARAEFVQRVRPRHAASSRLGDEGQLRGLRGGLTLQPGSLILIRDTRALRLEYYSRRQLHIGVARQVVQARPNCHKTDMERLVKARFCLVDGMVSGQVGASALTGQWLEASEVVVAGVGGACPGLVVAGRLLGWHDAPGQRGSAGRHTDIRGLGPHVGHTQEGAPGDGRRAQATA